jgi:hypothetical protein
MKVAAEGVESLFLKPLFTIRPPVEVFLVEEDPVASSSTGNFILFVTR